ncbi:MAG: hypothetical protein ACP5QA_11915 [Phycisphaerae bacterium]
MVSKNIQVKGKWLKGNSGHTYTAHAINSSGRVLAAVSVEVPLDARFDMQTCFGPSYVRKVELAAAKQVREIASGWKSFRSPVRA